MGRGLGIYQREQRTKLIHAIIVSAQLRAHGLGKNPSSHFIRRDLSGEKIWGQWSHFLESSGYT